MRKCNSHAIWSKPSAFQATKEGTRGSGTTTPLIVPAISALIRLSYRWRAVLITDVAQYTSIHTKAKYLDAKTRFPRTHRPPRQREESPHLAYPVYSKTSELVVPPAFGRINGSPPRVHNSARITPEPPRFGSSYLHSSLEFPSRHYRLYPATALLLLNFASQLLSELVDASSWLVDASPLPFPATMPATRPGTTHPLFGLAVIIVRSKPLRGGRPVARVFAFSLLLRRWPLLRASPTGATLNGDAIVSPPLPSRAALAHHATLNLTAARHACKAPARTSPARTVLLSPPEVHDDPHAPTAPAEATPSSEQPRGEHLQQPTPAPEHRQKKSCRTSVTNSASTPQRPAVGAPQLSPICSSSWTRSEGPPAPAADGLRMTPHPAGE